MYHKDNQNNQKSVACIQRMCNRQTLQYWSKELRIERIERPFLSFMRLFDHFKADCCSDLPTDMTLGIIQYHIDHSHKKKR